MKKKDWFDSHVEIIGLPKKQAAQLKNKLKDKLKEEIQTDQMERKR